MLPWTKEDRGKTKTHRVCVTCASGVPRRQLNATMSVGCTRLSEELLGGRNLATAATPEPLLSPKVLGKKRNH